MFETLFTTSVTLASVNSRAVLSSLIVSNSVFITPACSCCRCDIVVILLQALNLDSVNKTVQKQSLDLLKCCLNK